LEFYLAGLGLRDRAHRAGLDMCLPSFLPTGRAPASTRFERLFNPFLLGEERPPVPCDLSADVNALVVVTGPNSGGKTRLLQGIGLAQLLAQAGTFVPARQAELAWTNGLFVSLIQEASADQREGRLGTELIRIRRMFEQLSCNSLVILDELCSGTNPSEGEEIFELVVELVAKLEPQAFITTHFLQFAGRLEQEAPVAGMRFLQVHLDERLRPTYQFVPGVAQTSLAKQTAERLGVTREALLELVEEKLKERPALPGVPESDPVAARPAQAEPAGSREGVE
jgi:DNA mismatch repair protein MutS2